jgi:hypothetical protein
MFLTKLVAAVLIAAATTADGLLTDLQRAIDRDDRQAVAALIQYPITLATAGVRIPIRDPGALVQSFDAVFTPELKAAIRNRSAIRDGLIQVTTVNGEVRISNITPPYRPAAPKGPATAPPSSAPAATTRLTFAGPEQLARYAGSLAPGRSDRFVVYVERGRLIEARIDGVRGREILLRVLDAKTGKALEGTPPAGARVWTGRVPDAADYRVDVTRTGAGSGEPLSYLLVIRRR